MREKRAKGVFSMRSRDIASLPLDDNIKLSLRRRLAETLERIAALEAESRLENVRALRQHGPKE